MPDRKNKFKLIRLLPCDSAIVLRHDGRIEVITPSESAESSQVLLAAAVMVWALSEPEIYEFLVENFMARERHCYQNCGACDDDDGGGVNPDEPRRFGPN